MSVLPEESKAALHAFFEERVAAALKVRPDKFKKLLGSEEASLRVHDFFSNAECQRVFVSEGESS